MLLPLPVGEDHAAQVGHKLSHTFPGHSGPVRPRPGALVHEKGAIAPAGRCHDGRASAAIAVG